MVSPRTPDFSDLLARLTRALDGVGIPFMLIGGQAVLLHGEPRLTEDVDVTLAADPGALERVLGACRACDLTPLPENVAAFVRETFVLPARDRATHVRVDLIFSTTPYEHQAVARAARVQLAGAGVPFATAEDVIIHKLFANRPRDWEDAVGVVRRKGAELDWAYVQRWAAEFALVEGREGMPDLVARLRQITAGQ